MGTFGGELRRLRTARGLSLRALSTLVAYDFGYLGQIERGTRTPTATLAAACDRALQADGILVAAYDRQVGDEGMQRRTVLRALGVLAAGAPPLTSLEALRHGVGQALGSDVDEWDRIVADYGRAYYRTPPDTLMQQLSTDLAVLQTITAADDGRNRARLSRAAAQLSIIVALLLTQTGQAHMARRWWTTARRVADESRHPDTRVLARAWDVVNGCYDGRPLAEVIDRSNEGVALAGTSATAGVAGLWAGRAQALALAGRRDEAVEAVRQVADVTDRLDPAVVADVESMWGWPEHRLRHTESYVHTHVGNPPEAGAAQDRAMALYPPCQARLRAQVGLHRASCLIQDGHVPDGLRYAADLLDGLPAEQHNGLLYEVARHVVGVVPAGERRRSEHVELEARIPSPTLG